VRFWIGLGLSIEFLSWDLDGWGEMKQGEGTLRGLCWMRATLGLCVGVRGRLIPPWRMDDAVRSVCRQLPVWCRCIALAYVGLDTWRYFCAGIDVGWMDLLGGYWGV
jgi:hypothetical protein